MKYNAAVKALNSHVIDSKVIWECRRKLEEIGKINKVSLVKVLANSGIEEANTLIRREALESLTDSEAREMQLKEGVSGEGLNWERSTLEESSRNVSFQKIPSEL